MQSFKRLLKPLAIGTLVGVGGYYAYDRYKVNLQVQKLQNALKKQPVEIENLSSDIPALLEHEQQHHHTTHQNEDIELQKEESYQKKIEQQLQKKQQEQLSQQITSKQKQQQSQTPPKKQTIEKQPTPTQQQISQKSPEPTKEPKPIQPQPQVQKQTIPKDNQQQQQQTPKQVNIQQKHLKETTEKVQSIPLISQQQTKQQQKPSQLQQQKHLQEQKQEKQLKQEKQQKITENIPQSSAQTSQQKLKHEQEKPSQPQVIAPINLATLNKLSQLPHLPLVPSQKLKTAIVVADMGFTEQFQQKLLQTVKNLKHIPQHQEIKIYRMNLTNQENLKQMQKIYGHKIKDETIFLIKNQLDESFVDINFDMYMQYPTLINTYLTKLNLFKKQNEKDYLKKLQKMGPNESYIMFVYDDQQPQEKRLKALLAAKYIEMELALHHLDHVVKVLPVEAQLAKETGVIPQDKIRSKSLHIIRKHNEFTHTQPNVHLKFDNKSSPYHLLADIGFHNKRGQVAIQSYLSKIQTFNSLSITTPYILSVTVDKNRITTDNYKKLMDTFRDIKRRNIYPQVGIALKFSEVGYLGNDQAQNNEFCIKLANVAELQNQSSLHEIHNIEDAKNLGITEQNWLMSSNEYLYPHQVVSEELINDFVQKALSGQIPQYYRSDKPSTIQNVHKIVASNFNQQILQNNLDHFVFEYSDHCPSCKLISPLIGYINQVLEPIPVQERFDIHVMNSQKNRVKGQVYSPYTPNMSYYKNEWKHTGPVKIGLEAIKYQGLVGLYDFCVITKLLKTIDGKKFQQAINNAKGWNRAEFLL